MRAFFPLGEESVHRFASARPPRGGARRELLERGRAAFGAIVQELELDRESAEAVKRGTERGRGFRDAVLLALVSLAVFLPAAEATPRARCSYCSWSEANQGRSVTPYEYPVNSWYLVRPKNAILRYEESEFNFEIRTNSLGFRDIDHPRAKPLGEVRILAIGDSFTEGQGAPFDETWLSKIARALSNADDGKRYRVICAGVAGSDPFFEYRILVDQLLAYEPDLVLLVVNHSDVLDVMVRGGMERFLPDGTLRVGEPPPLTGLYKVSHFARFILLELFDYTHFVISRSEQSRRMNESLLELERLLVELEALLGRRGLDFELVVLPFRSELRRNEYDRLQELLDFASERGIAAIDAKPYLHAKLAHGDAKLGEVYWPEDGHFTPLGYRYVAEAVMEQLVPRLARASPGSGDDP